MNVGACISVPGVLEALSTIRKTGSTERSKGTGSGKQLKVMSKTKATVAAQLIVTLQFCSPLWNYFYL